MLKKTPYVCQYAVTRGNGFCEYFELDSKTYLNHDICHYVVEKKLKYANGFWGLLSRGKAFNDLAGKENPQTAELRYIEQIVGPIQSAYWGHISTNNFEQFTAHLDFKMPGVILASCLEEIKSLVENWERLPVGQSLILEWELDDFAER